MSVQHDEQPLTRREIRERERARTGSAPSGSSTSTGTTTGPGGSSPTTPAPTATTSRRVRTDTATTGGDVPILSSRPTAPAAPATPSAPAAASAQTGSTPAVKAPATAVPERTLTRRELRALLAEQEAAAGQSGEPNTGAAATVAAPTAAAPMVQPSAPTDAAPADTSDPAASVAPADVVPTEAPEAPSPSAVPAPAEPKLNTALFAAIGSPDQDDFAAEKATEITGSFHPPIAHAQITDELDNKARDVDDAASFDDIVARGIAATAAVTTTNALIMPAAPETAPQTTRRAVSDTGEIIVTGQIDLPRGLGSTGQHPNRYDSADVDRLFDQIEPEQPASDSVPVRASSAISTHTSTRGVIAPQKKKGISVPVVLAITAAVLLVGVVALLVGGLAFNLF